MNVQLAIQLGLLYAATLAGVLVACASVPALLSPVGAVVWIIAALPVEVALTLRRYYLPPGVTRFRAKATTRSRRLLHAKDGITYRTRLINALLQIRALASDLGTRYTATCCRKPFSIAGLRTESITLPSGLPRDWMTALLTIFRGQEFHMQVRNDCGCSRTRTRAILTRPGLVIPELFTALRAVRYNPRRGSLARTRAVHLHTSSIGGWIVGKGLSAARACAGFWHHNHLLSAFELCVIIPQVEA